MNVQITPGPKNEVPAATKQRLRPLRSVQETTALNTAWEAISPIALDLDQLEKGRIAGHLPGGDALPFDMLRTRLLQHMRDQGWRRVAITSPTAECGKSTVALNLALSLQRQPDTRTVLLEMDLRRPSLVQMLGTCGDIDLAHFLRGDRPFAPSAMRVGKNLTIAANRTPSLDASEVLSSCYLPLALRSIEESYEPDLMIFDTPPMLLAHDLMAFAKHVDCVLLVAGAEVTTAKQVDQCERDLFGQTQMLGVILNKCHHFGPGYGYGSYD